MEMEKNSSYFLGLESWMKDVEAIELKYCETLKDDPTLHLEFNNMDEMCQLYEEEETRLAYCDEDEESSSESEINEGGIIDQEYVLQRLKNFRRGFEQRAAETLTIPPKDLLCTSQAYQTPVKTEDRNVEDEKDSHVLLNWHIRISDNGSVFVIGKKGMDVTWWETTAIRERVDDDPRKVRTQTGTIYMLRGNICEEEMTNEGFSKTLTVQFQHGFPRDWQQLVRKFSSKSKIMLPLIVSALYRNGKDGCKSSELEEHRMNLRSPRHNMTAPLDILITSPVVQSPKMLQKSIKSEKIKDVKEETMDSAWERCHMQPEASHSATRNNSRSLKYIGDHSRHSPIKRVLKRESDEDYSPLPASRRNRIEIKREPLPHSQIICAKSRQFVDKANKERKRSPRKDVRKSFSNTFSDQCYVKVEVSSDEEENSFCNIRKRRKPEKFLHQTFCKEEPSQRVLRSTDLVLRKRSSQNGELNRRSHDDKALGMGNREFSNCKPSLKVKIERLNLPTRLARNMKKIQMDTTENHRKAVLGGALNETLSPAKAKRVLKRKKFNQLFEAQDSIPCKNQAKRIKTKRRKLSNWPYQYAANCQDFTKDAAYDYYDDSYDQDDYYWND